MRSGCCPVRDLYVFFVAHRYERTSSHSAERLNLCLRGKELRMLSSMFHLSMFSARPRKSFEMTNRRMRNNLQTLATLENAKKDGRKDVKDPKLSLKSETLLWKKGNMKTRKMKN